MDWFKTVFIPSICKRMNNPKYPCSAILTEKQSDICRRYMNARQCCDINYNTWFTVYEITIDDCHFSLREYGRYNIISRGPTKEERKEAEARHEAMLSERENVKFQRLVRYVTEDPERFQVRYNQAKDKLDKAQRAYNIITNDPEAEDYEIEDAKEDLEDAEKEVEKFIRANEAANK